MTTPPPILIHVPKSGGTTLVMAVTGGRRPPRAGDAYRHVYWNVDQTRMHSNAGDIFTDEGRERYAGRRMILTLRNPIDRLESEFGFLSNREEFRSLWKRISGTTYPGSFLEYVGLPGAADNMTKFLLGRDLYDPDPVEQDEFDRLVGRLDDEGFVFGLTERMPTTMRNIESRCGLTFDKTLPRYRTSLYKAERGDDWKMIEALFADNNSHDVALHAEVTRRFEAQTQGLSEDGEPRFEGGRYESVFLFTAGGGARTPFEIFVNDLDNPETCYEWIAARREVLMEIQREALRTSDRDPKRFLVAWLRAIAERFPELDIAPSAIDAEDPLTDVHRLCRATFAAT